MQGGKNRQPLGYTIVEVMVFLAISGVMFLISATFISGKQESTQFRQGVNDMNSQIQQVANQVANGEYNDISGNTCSASSASNSQPTIVSGVSTQGANLGCIFLGKVLQFPVGTDKTAFAVYNVVGRQTDATTSDAVQTFSTANPIVVDATAPSALSSITQTVLNQTSYSLELTNALECTAGCSTGGPTYVNIGAFGFFGSFGGYVSSATNNQSAAQQVITAVVPSTYSNPAFGQSQMAGQLNQQLRNINASGTDVISGGKFVMLCFKYGKHYANIKVGGTSGQTMTTSINMGYTSPCTP